MDQRSSALPGKALRGAGLSENAQPTLTTRISGHWVFSFRPPRRWAGRLCVQSAGLFSQDEILWPTSSIRALHNALERTAPLLRIGRRGPRRSASSRSAFRRRAAGRRHLMMHVVMVVMVVVVMMHLLHGRGRSGRSGRSGRGGFLRPGVTR